MLHLTAQTKILLAVEPVDFRKQIDGLAAMCRNDFLQQPRDGALYVFINRSRTMIKVLCYEHNGYWLAVKRLSRGRYSSWPIENTTITAVLAYQLRDILNSVVAMRHKLV